MHQRLASSQSDLARAIQTLPTKEQLASFIQGNADADLNAYLRVLPNRLRTLGEKLCQGIADKSIPLQALDINPHGTISLARGTNAAVKRSKGSGFNFIVNSYYLTREPRAIASTAKNGVHAYRHGPNIEDPTVVVQGEKGFIRLLVNPNYEGCGYNYVSLKQPPKAVAAIQGIANMQESCEALLPWINSFIQTKTRRGANKPDQKLETEVCNWLEGKAQGLFTADQAIPDTEGFMQIPAISHSKRFFVVPGVGPVAMKYFDTSKKGGSIGLVYSFRKDDKFFELSDTGIVEQGYPSRPGTCLRIWSEDDSKPMVLNHRPMMLERLFYSPNEKRLT